MTVLYSSCVCNIFAVIRFPRQVAICLGAARLCGGGSTVWLCGLA